MYALCGDLEQDHMIVFLISRFIATNQYDKVCVACLWVGGWVQGFSLTAPPPRHKYPKASAGIQNLDKSVHAYV
jgi:hypothetical protein